MDIMPVCIILVVAWSLGSILNELGVKQFIVDKAVHCGYYGAN